MHWKKQSERRVYKGWRNMLRKQFVLPDGQVADYDILENAAFVSVAAFTLDRAAIVVRQFRPGPERVLTSFSEGYIDQGETPLEAAHRELLEETGFKAGTIRFLYTDFQAYSTEKKHCFVATDCVSLAPPKLDATEHLEVLTIPFDNFRTFIKSDMPAPFVNQGLAYRALDTLGWL